ncbi:MAG: site-specific integrase, partial [Deltaproteobacteria bacterium]|nr:site-specific integrase [Deltaproteobacteria bacterium]
MDHLEDLIKQYGRHLQYERNRSAHTLRNYLSDLRQFHQFLKTEGACQDQAEREAVR